MQGSKKMLCPASCSLFFFLLLSRLDALTETNVFQYSGFRGRSKIPPLVSTTAASKALCAIACEQLAACKSFSFRNGTEGCSLFPRRIVASDVDLSVPSEDVHYSSVFASCPAGKGYVIVPETTKCIRVGSATKSWPQAANVCAEDGGHLLIIENVVVMQKVQDFLPKGGYHVGFTDHEMEHQYFWLDGTPVNGLLFHANGLTDDNYIRDEDCGKVRIRGVEPGLHDSPCSVVREFICSLPMNKQ